LDVIVHSIMRIGPTIKLSFYRAHLTMRMRDWERSATLWAEHRDSFPNQSSGYVFGAIVLREFGRLDDAEALLEAAQLRFPNEPATFAEHAMISHARSDWNQAEARWLVVRQKFPDRIEGYSGAVISLRAAGKEDQADDLLAEAVRLNPNDRRWITEWADFAHRRRDWSEAARRWRALRTSFPQVSVGWQREAQCLAELGMAQEAEALLDQALAYDPNNPGLLTDYAMAAVKRRSWIEAAMRWAVLRERCPRQWIGYSQGAAACRELGDIAAADTLLQQGAEVLPHDPRIIAEFARTAEMRKDWTEAEQRWRTAADRFPDNPACYVGVARALRAQRLADSLEPWLAEPMRRFPHDADLAEEFALAAMLKENWTVAMARLLDAQERFPDSAAFRRRFFEVQLRLAELEASDVRPGAPAATAADPAADRREIVLNFESLGGGGHGCEFGIFQRHMGAEPLGLLRWTDIYQAELATILETAFDGVGDPEFTEIFVPPGRDRSEYWTRDRRYHMAMRSFTLVDDVPLDRFTRQVGARFKFLRRKLIDDMTQSSKIFVYKNMKKTLTDAELMRIFDALQKYGQNVLLYIQLSDEQNPPGSVRYDRHRLMRGYVSHFSHSADRDEYLGGADEEFLTICRNALRLRSVG
jgi:tetratricopeptide (TPR) repeat protein